MQTSLLESLRKNWFLILFFGSLIVSYTSYDYRLSAVEKDQISIKQEIVSSDTEQRELTKQLISIGAKLDIIVETFKRLNISYTP